MGEADEAALDEMYGKGHADGYADAMLEASNDRHVTAVARVRVALNWILEEKVNYDRMQGYEIHQNDAERALARSLLATISDALEGRP